MGFFNWGRPEKKAPRKKEINMTPEEAYRAGADALRAGDTAEGLPLLEYAAERGSSAAAYRLGLYWDSAAWEAHKQNDMKGFHARIRTATDYYLAAALGGNINGRSALNRRTQDAEYAAGLLKQHPELVQAPEEPKAPPRPDSEVRAEALAAAKAADEKGDYAGALERYTLAAERHSGEAMLRLGEMYEQGLGAAADPDKAFSWYQKAGESVGGGEGRRNCLRLCREQYERYKNGPEEDKALLWCTRAAGQGDDDARYLCGAMYEKGIGTPADKARALQFYEAAADRGHVESCFKRGLFYSKGLGTGKDPERALAWLLYAARAGHAEAQYHCGNLFRDGLGTQRDLGRALYWYEKAAGQGCGPAEGSCYSLCGEHPELAEEKPLSWYEEAGEAGDVNAQFRCGVVWYEKTEPGHMAKAIYWFEKAAEQGNVQAQYNCGVAYNQSSEPTYNTEKALRWFREAAEQGQPKAMLSCGVLCYGDFELFGDETYRDDARRWFRMAAEQTKDEDVRERARKILDTQSYWDPGYRPLDR